jgi:hypothetical protein
LPACSANARTPNRMSGWISVAVRPSEVNSNTSLMLSANDASTLTIRGSNARAALSAARRSASLSGAGTTSVAIGTA